MTEVLLVVGVTWLVLAVALVALVACAGHAGHEEDAHFGFVPDLERPLAGAAVPVRRRRSVREAVHAALTHVPHRAQSA